MPHRILLPLLLILALGALSCKTNERNMNDAYQKAIAGRDAEAAELDSIVYHKIRHEMKHGEMVVNGDTVEVSTQFVRVTDGGGGINESIKPYCVVVAQFKQIFNAKSMRERVMEAGYPGAFIVETREPYYFVVAASYNDAAEAVSALERARADGALTLKAPCPFILQPAQTRQR